MGCACATHGVEEPPAVVNRQAASKHASDGSAFELQTEDVKSQEQHQAQSVKAYTYGRVLGKGAFGVVFAATKREGATRVAVKVVDMGDKDKGQRQRTWGEVELWQSVGNHPNVVGLLGSFADKERMCVVMERCRCTISDVLRQDPSGAHARATHHLQPSRDPFQISHYLHQMLLGIQACHHALIVHRDIKTDNFLVSEDGAGTIKLGDFGLAARLPRGGKGSLRGQAGTAPMMSPEMLKGKEYGLATDIWSFAAMAYKMIFRELPYTPKEMNVKEVKKAIVKGETPRRIQGVAQLHDETEAAFLAFLLQRDPRHRPAVQAALEHPFLQSNASTQSGRDMQQAAKAVSEETSAPSEGDVLQDDHDSRRTSTPPEATNWQVLAPTPVASTGR